MYSVKEVIEKNKAYKKADELSSALFSESREYNNQIDLAEVETLSYQEIKELLSIVGTRFTDKNVLIDIKKIALKKKAEIYPEILGVHYYPELKEIDWLSETEKVRLDRLLGNRMTKSSQIKELDERTIKFLMDRKILEKRYVLECDCGDFDCYERIITEDRLNKFKEYWQKEKSGIETTDEEDEELNYGCIMLNCDNENLEVCDEDDFKTYLTDIRYKRLKEPDRTLDKL